MGTIVIAAYIAAQMLADIMALKIALVAGFSVDAGTFIYPITFTLRDLVHKLLGRRAAQVLIITAAFINLAMAGLFAFAAWLPPDLAVGEQMEFATVLTPVWRIVIASIIAEVLAELVDTEAYHWVVTKITHRCQWLRVLISNGVSIPLDSLIFCWGAFGGVLPTTIVWSLFWSNVVVKSVVTLMSLPWIYAVKDKGHDTNLYN